MRMPSLFFLLLSTASVFFQSVAHSAPPIAFRDSGGHLYLSAASCNDPQALKRVAALKDWTSRLDEPVGDAPCTCTKENQCKFAIDHISSKFVRDAFGTTSVVDGPNCFNAAF